MSAPCGRDTCVCREDTNHEDMIHTRTHSKMSFERYPGGRDRDGWTRVVVDYLRPVWGARRGRNAGPTTGGEQGAPRAAWSREPKQSWIRGNETGHPWFGAADRVLVEPALIKLSGEDFVRTLSRGTNRHQFAESELRRLFVESARVFRNDSLALNTSTTRSLAPVRGEGPRRAGVGVRTLDVVGVPSPSLAQPPTALHRSPERCTGFGASMSRQFYFDIATFFPPSTSFLELGILNGETTLFLALLFRKVHAADGHQQAFDNAEKLHTTAKRDLGLPKVSTSLSFHWLDAYNANWDLVFGPPNLLDVDVVFIDAEHSWRSASEDISNALKFPRVQWLVIDDIAHLDVLNAVSGFVRRGVLECPFPVGARYNDWCTSDHPVRVATEQLLYWGDRAVSENPVNLVAELLQGQKNGTVDVEAMLRRGDYVPQDPVLVPEALICRVIRDWERDPVVVRHLPVEERGYEMNVTRMVLADSPVLSSSEGEHRAVGEHQPVVERRSSDGDQETKDRIFFSGLRGTGPRPLPRRTTSPLSSPAHLNTLVNPRGPVDRPILAPELWGKLRDDYNLSLSNGGFRPPLKHCCSIFNETFVYEPRVRSIFQDIVNHALSKPFALYSVPEATIDMLKKRPMLAQFKMVGSGPEEVRRGKEQRERRRRRAQGVGTSNGTSSSSKGVGKGGAVGPPGEVSVSTTAVAGGPPHSRNLADIVTRRHSADDHLFEVHTLPSDDDREQFGHIDWMEAEGYNSPLGLHKNPVSMVDVLQKNVEGAPSGFSRGRFRRARQEANFQAIFQFQLVLSWQIRKPRASVSLTEIKRGKTFARFRRRRRAVLWQRARRFIRSGDLLDRFDQFGKQDGTKMVMNSSFAHSIVFNAGNPHARAAELFFPPPRGKFPAYEAFEQEAFLTALDAYPPGGPPTSDNGDSIALDRMYRLLGPGDGESLIFAPTGCSGSTDDADFLGDLTTASSSTSDGDVAPRSPLVKYGELEKPDRKLLLEQLDQHYHDLLEELPEEVREELPALCLDPAGSDEEDALLVGGPLNIHFDPKKLPDML